MFKYCVLYLCENYNTIIKRNAKIFKTELFPAHITIQSNLSLDRAKIIADGYKDIKPTFQAYGPAIQTHTRVAAGIQLLDFYAIQQPLKVNGFETNIHISLAYRNSPFSEMDIAIANMNIPKIDSNLNVCIADCRLSPNKWMIM